MRSFRGFVLFLAVPAVLTLGAGPAAGQDLPTVESVTLIEGRPDVFQPRTGTSNLDAGLLVAGSSRYDHDGDGVLFGETYVGFQWTPAGGLRMFDIKDELYYQPQFQTPYEIADDGTMAGTIIFRSTFENRPFRWSPADDFTFLPLPAGGWIGGATAISSDGTVIGGTLRQGVFGDLPSRAATWTGGAFSFLPTDEPWSNVTDVNADGSVVVGAAGSSEETLQAARWVGGVEDRVRKKGRTSAALFTSDDGSIALGTSTSRRGEQVLARWDERGRVKTFGLPDGFVAIETLNDVNPTATAAVGALSDGSNWAPFVWTLDGGFVVLGELGRADDYDLSAAVAVSDDGNAVLGVVRSSVVFNGDPPQLAFLWRPDLGVVTIDTILAASGYTESGFFSVDGLSGDGLTLVAVGLEVTIFDTNSRIIRLNP